MQGNPPDEKLHCVRCGEVIGAYEPLIVVIDGEAHQTSKDLARQRDCQLEECYHHDCYA